MKNLHLLNRQERLSLFLRAVSRGDNQETRAVIDATPRIDVKIIDFSPDLHALMVATLFHCLVQTDLVCIINDLWEHYDNDEAFLCARLYATHFAVRDEAWVSICNDYGFDYEKLVTLWGDFLYVNYAPRWDWIKRLVLHQTEYKVGANQIVRLELPTVEEEKQEYRGFIESLRRLF